MWSSEDDKVIAVENALSCNTLDGNYPSKYALPEINMAPENGWLDNYSFLLGMAYFQGRTVSFRECRCILEKDHFHIIHEPPFVLCNFPLLEPWVKPRSTRHLLRDDA